MRRESPKKYIPKRTRAKDDPDENVYLALLKLPKKMKNGIGIIVSFPNPPKDRETMAHIASKRHYLRVIDIQQVPIIIADPNSLQQDRFSTKSSNYVGKRPGKVSETEKHLKIVTKKNGKKKETIKTIYPIKRGN